MIIDQKFSAFLEQYAIYLNYGLSLYGQGFLSKKIEMRAGRAGKISSLASLYDVNLGAYLSANAGDYKNCSLGNYGSYADGVKILGTHDFNRITTSICTVEVPKSSRLFTNFKGKKPFINLYHTIIGHDVWLGSNVQIKNGLVIGHGAIVGAGSVVTKHVPPYAIVGGSPAKIIRMRFADNDIERLLASAWYRYDWENIEVDWGDMHNCLSQMEEHIATGKVPLLEQGFRYEIKDSKNMQLTPACWSLERQLQGLFNEQDMLKLFEQPQIKAHSIS